MKSLVKAYMVNTTQVGVCNDRLQGIADFYEQQKEIYAK